MKELTGVWLALLCLTTIYTTVEACSCIFQPKEKTYCAEYSHFGIKIRVKSLESTQQHGDSVYRIKKIKKKNIFRWKTGVKRNEVDLTRIYTASNSAACGVVLQPGKRYLVTGQIQSGFQPKRLRVGLCDIVLKWSKVGKTFKNFVKNTEC